MQSLCCLKQLFFGLRFTFVLKLLLTSSGSGFRCHFDSFHQCKWQILIIFHVVFATKLWLMFKRLFSAISCQNSVKILVCILISLILKFHRIIFSFTVHSKKWVLLNIHVVSASKIYISIKRQSFLITAIFMSIPNAMISLFQNININFLYYCINFP